MGIGVGIFLLAVGAILAFAVEAEAEGVNLETVGVILMVVGALGIVLSLVFWGSWGAAGVRRTRVTSDRVGDRVVEERRDDVL